MIILHTHHIIPKHMGGTDDPSNLVELTIEDHAIAHKILYGLYGKIEDKIAWLSLSGQMSDKERWYALSKIGSDKMAPIRKIVYKKEGNPFFGKKHKNATIEIIRSKKTGVSSYNKGIPNRKCSCIICKKETDANNVGRCKHRVVI